MADQGYIPQHERLRTFERYIHTNACSDEGGWFAFFTLENGNDYDRAKLSGLYVNGCDSEEEAIRELITLAVMSRPTVDLDAAVEGFGLEIM